MLLIISFIVSFCLVFLSSVFAHEDTKNFDFTKYVVFLQYIFSVYAHEIINFDMKNQNTKIRIKDIATMAGVSEGTVDRVLHERGEVSEKSREAVQRVLDEINYSPNLLARSLASKKHYRFICLIPTHKPTDYWESVEKGFSQAAIDYLHYNIHIERKFFNQFDANSFVDVSKALIKSQPDAVIMAPIFRDETLAFTKELQQLEIPFSFIDSMIEDTEFLTYYGQNSFQSGYIAAKLLLNSLPNAAQVLVLRTNRKGAVSNQTIARINGFMSFVSENKLSNIELIHLEMNDENEDANREILSDVFSKNTNLKAAITFNSRVYRLANHLETLQHADVRLIGYDLLQKNVDYLKQDIVSYLIAQRPEKQAYFTIRDMCAKLILKQNITKINYVPIDILIKENIEDYTQFGE